MAVTQIVILQNDQFDMTTDNGAYFSLGWADLNGPSGPNMPAIPDTVHAVIWNSLQGPNEIQSYDPSTGMMTGNTPLSSASDAVGSTTVQALLDWATTRYDQVQAAETAYETAVDDGTATEQQNWQDYQS
tara:strand:+ start:74 stop:463 length:390 start_codon:yes stop_codon:yes gene_type:complete